VILADTSGLLALFNEREPRHHDVRSALTHVPAPIIVSPYVVAELDYLVGRRIGMAAELAVLRELRCVAYGREARDRTEVQLGRRLGEHRQDAPRRPRDNRLHRTHEIHT